MEARELQRVERENKLKVEQQLTAHANAFEVKLHQLQDDTYSEYFKACTQRKLFRGPKYG